MSKINPYDLPPEDERRVRIVLNNIEWDASEEVNTALPSKLSIPVDAFYPEDEMIATAIDAASFVCGYCISDCDVEPIDYKPKQSSESTEQDSLSDTLDYQGEIF